MALLCVHLLHTCKEGTGHAQPHRALGNSAGSQTNSQATGTLDTARRCIPKSLSPPPPRGECSHEGPCSGAIAVQSAAHGKALLTHS